MNNSHALLTDQRAVQKPVFTGKAALHKHAHRSPLSFGYAGSLDILVVNADGDDAASREMAQHHIKEGHQVTIVSFNPSVESSQEAWTVTSLKPMMKAGLAQPGEPNTANILDAIKRGKWDLIHFNGLRAAVLKFFLSTIREVQIAYVVTVTNIPGHNQLSPNRESQSMSLWGQQLLAGAARIITATPCEASQLSQRYCLDGAHFTSMRIEPTNTSTPSDELASQLLEIYYEVFFTQLDRILDLN